jgi:hypothetical protein
LEDGREIYAPGRTLVVVFRPVKRVGFVIPMLITPATGRMRQAPETEELARLNAVRVEAVLSRFPVHRLSKKGRIHIEINASDETGELKTRWEVSHNTKYGQPGALAYKVDTLIVNRGLSRGILHFTS